MKTGSGPNRLLVQSPWPVHRRRKRTDRPVPGPVPRLVGQADRRRQGLRRSGAEVQRRADRHRRARCRCAGRYLVVPFRAFRRDRPTGRPVRPGRGGHRGLRRLAAGRLRIRRPALRAALRALDAAVLLQQAGMGRGRPAGPRTDLLARVRRMGSAAAARRRRPKIGARLGQCPIDFLDVRGTELGVRRRLLRQVDPDVHRPGHHRGGQLPAGFRRTPRVTP